MFFAAVAICATGCSTKSQSVTTAPSQQAVTRDDGGKATFMPQAIAYRTSADVTNYVPVTLNDSRTSVVSFPAPTDITSATAPLALGEGWYLDRRGISANTAFTNWTYPEYARMSKAPTTAEIMDNLKTDARVTEIVALPFEAGEGGMREAITALRNGDYKVVYQAKTLK